MRHAGRYAGAPAGLFRAALALFAALYPAAAAASDADLKPRLAVKAPAKPAQRPSIAVKGSAAIKPLAAPGGGHLARPHGGPERLAGPPAAAPRPTSRPPPPPLPSSPPERPPTVARPSVESRIAAARETYQAGRYAEVPTALVKLLSESPLSPQQLAAVYELLASAYVALGQTELAIRCFGEVLSRRPAFALDPVRISPKIRAALDQAKLQAAGQQTAAAAAHKAL